MNLKKDKKKIVHMIYSGLGGASKMGIELVRNFANSKKVNNVVIFNGVEKLYSDYSAQISKLGMQFFFIKSLGFYKNIRSIFDYLKKTNPETIITHEIGLLPLFFFKLFRKVKIISVLHSPFQNSKIILKIILMLVISNKVVFVTRKKDFLYKVVKFIFSKVLIIENGIKITHPINKKSNKKKFLIGKSIRFVDQKKPELIIDICNLYKKYLIKNNIIFTIAGDGPNFKKFNNLIQKNKLQNLIFLEGYLPEKKLMKWYRKLDLFLNLSNSENLSVSILEAMSIPLPVIASKLKSNKVICKRIFYGQKPILLSINEPQQVFKKILKIYKNKNLSKKISKSAFKNVKLYYSSKRMSDQYLKLI